MSYQVFDRKLHQDAESNADQTEFRALLFGSANVEAGIEDDNIANSLDDYQLDQQLDEDWAMDDAAKDSAAGLLLEKLRMRSEILGDHYPFEINGAEVSLKPGETSLVYRFCLAVSNAPNITKGEFTKLPREFEQIAAQVTRLMLGQGAQWLHTGWPRVQGAPRKFKDLVEYIKAETNSLHEWTWSPHAGLEDDDAIKIKDCGVDYIAWHDFFNNRDGKLYVMGQCACGNDWVNKFNDIKPKKLESWIRPLSLVSPIKTMAILFCSASGYLIDSSHEDNILLDRLRLTLICENNQLILEEKDNLESLIEMVKDAN